jgi:hypothetical protein
LDSDHLPDPGAQYFQLSGREFNYASGVPVHATELPRLQLLFHCNDLQLIVQVNDINGIVHEKSMHGSTREKMEPVSGWKMLGKHQALPSPEKRPRLAQMFRQYLSRLRINQFYGHTDCARIY